MSRHLADRREPSDGGRAKHFAEVERQLGAAGAHPAAKALHARAQSRLDGARLKEFTRIERGREA